MMRGYLCAVVLAGGVALTAVRADPPTAAERGYQALTTQSFTPAIWSVKSYDEAWKVWGVKEKPESYDRAFREHYGLHPAPYPNDGLPMGLRYGKGLLGKGLASDCMMCHGGSILGKSYIGLGNASLDVEAVFGELSLASGTTRKLPFRFSNARGTSEAGMFAVFLLSYREPNLAFTLKKHDLGFNDQTCEDVPAWWHLQKKKSMYFTGSTNSRSVRALMQFMLSPPNSLKTFTDAEPTFEDIQAFLLSIKAPKYPFPIDQKLAARGEKLFTANCSSCHGTYGEKWTYPNKIVPLDEIGTDRSRANHQGEKFAVHYNKSWFAQEKRLDGAGAMKTTVTGYQAPPLDGIWATAPYLHNGSVPTLYGMLNSKARPKIFTRSFRTDEADYDKVNVGWKVQVLQRGPADDVPPLERRKVYDTTQPGRGNGGHTFGDDFTEEQRRAVIEYLKTL
jgi:mono/diheme cytochrome c family protein